MKKKQSQKRIKLCLSRSTYPINGSVIGSIHVSPDIELSSLQVYVAGRCRLDSRWHDINAAKRRYGTHPCHKSSNLPEWVEKIAEASYFNVKINGSNKTKDNLIKDSDHQMQYGKKENTKHESICFWSTNVLELYSNGSLKVPFFQNGNDDDCETSTPLAMSGSKWFTNATKYIEEMQGNLECDESSHEEQGSYYEEGSDSSVSTTSKEYYESDSESFETQNLENEVASQPHALVHQQYDVGLNEESIDAENQQPPSILTNQVTDAQPEDNQLQQENLSTKHYTFRADLPSDIVPTLYAVCVRYYYSVVVYATDINGEVSQIDILLSHYFFEKS